MRQLGPLSARTLWRAWSKRFQHCSSLRDGDIARGFAVHEPRAVSCLSLSSKSYRLSAANKRVSIGGLQVDSCAVVPLRPMLVACAVANWFCKLVTVDAAGCKLPLMMLAARMPPFAIRSSIDIDTVELRSSVLDHELTNKWLVAQAPTKRVVSVLVFVVVDCVGLVVV